MAKRYMYTYTRKELLRRRWVGVMVGFPSWMIVSFVVLAFFFQLDNPPVLLILSAMVSAVLVYLTWQFNTHQINTKFTEVD